jgi:putative membrane protein
VVGTGGSVDPNRPSDPDPRPDPSHGAETDAEVDVDTDQPLVGSDDYAYRSYDGAAPLEELVAEAPIEAAAPMRSPLALGGTAVAGFAMGIAELMPGFSGGTVALVAGIYERLIAAIRQGARTLSLLVQGRPKDALRALLAIDWAFVTVLLIGMATAVLMLASTLEGLLEQRPAELRAVFLGLILGAALVASRQLREPSARHAVVAIVSAAAFFVLLGFGRGEVTDPTGPWFLLGGALSIMAWILPGVSGSFLLVVLGLYTAVIGALSARDLVPITLFAIGALVGLASFSTLLNWVLARYHDLLLAMLIGLMVGSARVLWPWPADKALGSAELGAPAGAEAFLALALGLAAFSLVYMFGLAASAVERRRGRRRAINAEVDPS